MCTIVSSSDPLLTCCTPVFSASAEIMCWNIFHVAGFRRNSWFPSCTALLFVGERSSRASRKPLGALCSALLMLFILFVLPNLHLSRQQATDWSTRQGCLQYMWQVARSTRRAFSTEMLFEDSVLPHSAGQEYFCCWSELCLFSYSSCFCYSL